MKIMLKRVVTAALLLFVIFLIWLIFKPDSPHLRFMSNGTVKVIGCESNIRHSDSVNCLSLHCEKALFESEIIPFGMSAVRRFHKYGISNEKGISVHYVHYADNGASVFAMCKMNNKISVSLRDISEEEFSAVFNTKE
ncbi:MAG: hypothetical protein KME63_09350 [Candidatus Thiodiazotropha sp. (ex Clathrolucina costata)]|nr:hypothetical protein [Candidatus Thiodiazotropha taylori]MCG7864312.1 hypothetical protein [Candidatus Thiodiazotropha endolucinida]